MSRSSARLGVLLCLVALSPVYAHGGVKLGGVAVGVGFTHYSGPYYGYPYYDPFWYGPYAGFPWAPAFYTSAPSRPMGEIKLASVDKQAEIYINGAYAGLAKDLKHIWLDPGVYDFEMRAQKRAPVERRVYVLTNKTLKLDFSGSAR